MIAESELVFDNKTNALLLVVVLSDENSVVVTVLTLLLLNVFIDAEFVLDTGPIDAISLSVPVAILEAVLRDEKLRSDTMEGNVVSMFVVS